MKTIIEGIDLIMETKKNSLPTQSGILGFLKVNSDLTTASFKEECPSVLFERKSIRLKHGNGFNVSFNPEKNAYRITIGIDANEPNWSKAVLDFTHCLDYVEGREEE